MGQMASGVSGPTVQAGVPLAPLLARRLARSSQERITTKVTRSKDVTGRTERNELVPIKENRPQENTNQCFHKGERLR